VIYWAVVPLLWFCPLETVPLLGSRAAAALKQAAPARALLCRPTAGAPEYFDDWAHAWARVRVEGPGVSLSECDDKGCKLKPLEWDNVPREK
jgi:hypothetical protein